MKAKQNNIEYRKAFLAKKYQVKIKFLEFKRKQHLQRFKRFVEVVSQDNFISTWCNNGNDRINIQGIPNTKTALIINSQGKTLIFNYES